MLEWRLCANPNTLFYKLWLYLQLISNATVKVAEMVANLTAEANNLAAADISASVFLVDQLTDEAATNPEVWNDRC